MKLSQLFNFLWIGVKGVKLKFYENILTTIYNEIEFIRNLKYVYKMKIVLNFTEKKIEVLNMFCVINNNNLRIYQFRSFTWVYRRISFFFKYFIHYRSFMENVIYIYSIHYIIYSVLAGTMKNQQTHKVNKVKIHLSCR